jgi:hypothetical protein
MKRDPSRKLDPETMLALAKARQKQDRRAVSYLIAAAIMVLGLGIVWWFLWPEEPIRFNLAAYDAVGSPGEDMKLDARLEPAGTAPARREKHELRFQIKETQTDQSSATESGVGTYIRWKAPKDKTQVVEFMVRHQYHNNPRNVIRDQGRAFIWPTDTKLLVVDVNHALTEGVEGLAGNTAPKLRSAAAATLRDLSTRYKIVYLSAGASDPSRYKKLRSWLAQLVPPGPVLGSSEPLGASDGDKFTISQIEQLKKRFTAPALGVFGRAAEAQAAVDAGWKAIVIGDARDLPAGATAIASWAEFPKQ